MSALFWDGSYEIAKHLMAAHPDADLSNVTLRKIFEWATALPDFADDPAAVNDDLLNAIYQDWFEEINPV